VYRTGSVPIYDPAKHADFKGLLSLSSRERQNQLGEETGSVRSPDSRVQTCGALPSRLVQGSIMSRAMRSSRSANWNRRSTTPAGEISFEMVGRQVLVFVDLLGGGELDGVGVSAG
jgi:hypothetical protein